MPLRDAEDTEALDRLLRLGGREGLARVLHLYLENTPRRIREAREALGADDRERLREVALSIRSTSPLVGASGLTRLADALLAAAEAPGAAGADQCLTEMEAELDAARRRWAGRLAADGAPEA